MSTRSVVPAEEYIPQNPHHLAKGRWHLTGLYIFIYEIKKSQFEKLSYNSKEASLSKLNLASTRAFPLKILGTKLKSTKTK